MTFWLGAPGEPTRYMVLAGFTTSFLAYFAVRGDWHGDALSEALLLLAILGALVTLPFLPYVLLVRTRAALAVMPIAAWGGLVAVYALAEQDTKHSSMAGLDIFAVFPLGALLGLTAWLFEAIPLAVLRRRRSGVSSSQHTNEG